MPANKIRHAQRTPRPAATPAARAAAKKAPAPAAQPALQPAAAKTADAFDAPAKASKTAMAGAPPRAESFPFSQGANGGLTAPVDFSRFLDASDPACADPTDATITAKSKTLLLDYVKTAQFGEFTGERGVPIRYAVFAPPPGTPIKGVINLVSGRTESFVKYAETLYNLRDLRAQGYVIASMDHRGQGFSGREVAGADLKDHVRDFDDFVRDEASFTGILQGRFGKDAPYSILAHSMGGAIATRYLQTHPGDYSKAALLSPMLDIESGYPDVIEHALAEAGAVFAPEKFALGQKPWAPEVFATNRLTNSPARLQMENDYFEAFPETKLSGTTWGWVHESVDATRKLMKHSELDKLRGVDVHVLRATDDHHVETGAEDAFAKYLGCEEKSYFWTDETGAQRGTRHELLFHTDEVRNRVLADVRAILTR